VTNLVVRQEGVCFYLYGDFGWQETHYSEKEIYGDDSVDVRYLDDVGCFDVSGRLISITHSDIVTNRYGEVSGDRHLYQCEYVDASSDALLKETEELHTLQDGRDRVMETAVWFESGNVDHVTCRAWESVLGVDTSKCVTVTSGSPAIVQADSKQEAIGKVLVEYALPVDDTGFPIVDCTTYSQYFSFIVTGVGDGLWEVVVALAPEKVKLNESISSLGNHMSAIAAGASEVIVAACPGLCYSLCCTDDLSLPMKEGKRVLATGDRVNIMIPVGQNFFRIRVSENKTEQ